jgi:hypothetical protein
MFIVLVLGLPPGGRWGYILVSLILTTPSAPYSEQRAIQSIPVQEAPRSYITSLCELDGTYGAPFNPNTDLSRLRLRRSILVIFFSQECLHLEL